MKILVFDDNATNRAAAEAQLKGHDLTVVGTYDEAQKLLTSEINWSTGERSSASSFDVVLVDLLVPASAQEQSSRELAGKEMPVGVFIGLLAAFNGLAKYVAVFTDSSHHDHPASACFDAFSDGEPNPIPFTVNDCRVIFSNNRGWVGEFNSDDLSTPLPWREAEKLPQSKRVYTKSWAKLLEYLLTGKVANDDD